MQGHIKRLAPFRGTQAVRVTVTWRKTRISRISVEYAKPHLLRRFLEGLRK
jgi:hypothetical protein